MRLTESRMAKPSSYKGRGSASKMPGRFQSRVVQLDGADPYIKRNPDTEYKAIRAVSIISHNQSPDVPFDRSINPYQGCEHGCVYCYARPSHSYLELSPGLDFETKIFYKANAVATLLAEWEKPSYECQPITIGANTDPYQPAEKKLQMTRQLLEAFLEYRHPLSIITKGVLMSRDIDLLAELAVRNLVSVAISIPTADRALKRILEPRVKVRDSYARPSHSYLELSPGLDFETKIFYKENAVATLLAEWEKPSYECQPITIGANTDPYQPAEKKLQMTRQLLEAFLEYRHPLSIITKGVLMSRDIDLLAELAVRNLVSVAISIPTADRALKRILEPRVPSASARFGLIEKLAEAQVPVSLLMAPIIPALNDMEIESVLKSAAEAGVRGAGWILLRLPHETKQIFEDWLQVHMPERANHVMSLLRQASGGRLYDNRFGIRQRGKGPYAEMIKQRFNAACRRYRICAGPGKETLDCSQFRRPGEHQMGLDFD